MKNSIKILSLCNILLIMLLVSFFYCCGEQNKSVNVKLRYIDENGNPISNASINLGDLVEQTDQNGEIQTILKKIPKNKNKKIMIEVNKEPYFPGFITEIEIPKDQKHIEQDIVVNRKLFADIAWKYVRGGIVVPVEGGKIQLRDSSGQKLADGRTNAQGYIKLAFQAKKETEVFVSAVLEPIIEAKYPKIPEPQQRSIFVSGEANYSVNLVSGEAPKQKTFIAGIDGLDNISDVTMYVNDRKVIHETKGNTLAYKGDFYRSDKVIVKLEHPDYDFEPKSKLYNISPDTDIYQSQFKASNKPPLRTFIISGVDPDNRSTTDFTVYINGERVEKTVDANNQVIVTKRINDGRTTVSLSHPEYGFTYKPENGIFNLIEGQNEYRLIAEGFSEPITVRIYCYEQTDQPIPNVEISSNDMTVSGKTNSQGQLMAKVKGDKTISLIFQKEGYCTDEGIQLKLPKKGEVSLNRYLMKQNISNQVLGICPFDYESPDLMADANQGKRLISDRLKNEYNIIVSDIADIPYEKLSDGWDDSKIRADLALKGKLAKDEDGNRINLSCNLVDKSGETIISTSAQGANIGTSANIMVRKIVERYPFEGRITDISFSGIKISVGQRQGINNDDDFEIYHITRDKEGRVSNKKNLIARGNVTQVSNDFSTINITEKIGDGSFAVGDEVKRINKGGFTKLELTVKNPETNSPLEGMNIYYGDPSVYGGKTDDDGLVSFDVPSGIGTKIFGTALGWQLDISVTPRGKIMKAEYNAERLKYNLFVTSEPSNCSVFINGKQIGRTPIENYAIAGDSYEFKVVDDSTRKGSRVLTIVIPDQSPERRFEAMGIEYKLLGRDISINIPLLVSLDDERKNEARNLINKRSYAEAIEWLRPVSKNLKSDYLESRQMIGAIYVNNLSDYDKGIETFNEIITIDKQYASAYYNLGYCYYKKGEYDKATDAFESVIRNRSYLLDEDVMRIIHDTKFYLAKNQYEKEKRAGNWSMAIIKADDYKIFFERDLTKKAEYKKDKDYFDRSAMEINRIIEEINSKSYGK